MHRVVFSCCIWKAGQSVVTRSQLPRSLAPASLLIASLLIAPPQLFAQKATQPPIGSRAVPVLTIGSLHFRDLNRNGKLDPFEDWRLTAEQRAIDLLARLSLEEKAGLMMHDSAPAAGPSGIGRGTEYDLPAASSIILNKKVATFITRLTTDAASLATQNNLLQQQAEASRFAIPLTISTDPRNNFHSTLGAGNDAGSFSQWPDTTGMGAIGDPAVTRNFGDIVRQEYRSVGIQEALSPQADLATEPRWGRIDGTFGEDPVAVKAQVEAYIAGFQNGESGLKRDSVMCVVKHWAGYGAMKDGLDSHNSYSRHAVLSTQAFEQHLIPFEGAFAAHVAAVMPTYAILDTPTISGKPTEPVGAGFNKQLLTGLLRGRFGFQGIILTDWLITSTCTGECLAGASAGKQPGIVPGKFGMPWGVESLTTEQRFAKAIAAGVDQFGGVSDSDLIVKLVREGQVTESRIDDSARRILVQKFELGLFENPYVDAAKAATIAGRPAFKQAALAAQERSMVLLANKQTLPLGASMHKVWLIGVDAKAAKQAGLIVAATPAEADFALARMHAPYQLLHPGYFFGSRQHEGDLDFKAEDPQLAELSKLPATLPVVADVYLDRPAILAPLVRRASALIADFGASDEALLAVITGKAQPRGHLPFELPSSMEAVRQQRSDLPHDSAAPLYKIGFGMTYTH
jgi:beta-glucosidase